MIRSKDVNLEVSKMELAIEKGNDKELVKAIVKGVAVMLKVVRDMKTNQVAIMRKMNVKLVEPTRRDTEEAKDVVEEKTNTVG